MQAEIWIGFSLPTAVSQNNILPYEFHGIEMGAWEDFMFWESDFG